MDETTASVRQMYEQYPYPAGTPQIRAAADARLVLSYVERSRSHRGALNVLDAGCGRGLGTRGSAIAQPDVSFVGADINRVALREASEWAVQAGLENVRFQECDLMTLEGLDVPGEGFDVIYSLGVVHHMSDPLTGLSKLREVLAPHGVVVFMVYAEHGRVPLKRVTNAINLLFPEEAPTAARIELGRALAEVARDGIMSNTFWENTAKVNDVEFVDRCLNVNEACYDITSLWELLSSAGMRFIRWIEPQDWALEKVLPEGELLHRARELSELDQYRFIEHLCWQNAFEMILSHDDNAPHAPLSIEAAPNMTFCVNPDALIICERRNLRGAQRVEGLAYALRHREAVRVSKGPFASGLLALEHQIEPFTGDEWARAMAQSNMSPEVAYAVLMELVQREVLFCPHACDI